MVYVVFDTKSDVYNYVPLTGEDQFVILNYHSILYKISQTSESNGETAKYKCEVSINDGATYTTECTEKGFGDSFTYNNVTVYFGGVEFVASNSSPICFHENTIIPTDQGNIKIKNLKSCYTIDNNRIICVLQSPCNPSHLVLIEQNAFGKGVPSEDIRLTLNHEVVIQSKIVPVFSLLNNSKVRLIKNDNANVYNIIVLNKNVITVSNLPCLIIKMTQKVLNEVEILFSNGQPEIRMSIHSGSKQLTKATYVLNISEYNHFKQSVKI